RVAVLTLHVPAGLRLGALGARLGLLLLVAAAVGLQLGLAGAAGGHAAPAAAPAGLAGQRPAPAAQPGEHVLHLRQGHLGAALPGLGVLGEDVQDERGAVDHLGLGRVLQVDDLGGGELAVAHHGVGAGGLHDVAQLGGLAGADVGGGVGFGAALDHALEIGRAHV